MTLRVCLVAAPLTARSGVYRSTYELVQRANLIGLDWSAVIGLRPAAMLQPGMTDSHVTEFTADRKAFQTVRQIRSVLEDDPNFRGADVLISLIPQSDMALASRRGDSRPWVAYVRGLPWPEKGKRNPLVAEYWKRAESHALRRANDVWATTKVLGDVVAEARTPTVVPAGVEPLERITDGSGTTGALVWAGRFVEEKRPEFFLDLAQELGVPARLFGEGPMDAELRSRAGGAVTVQGWTEPDRLWTDARVYVGTSYREAFGRSVVEAASAGVPVVLSDQYGAAPFLFTDPELRRDFVLPVDDRAAWIRAIRRLLENPELSRRVSDHVHSNALALSMENSVRGIEKRLEALR